MTARTVAGKAVPRGAFPHVKVAGGFVFVSGTSSRRPDNTFAGVAVDEFGTTDLDIREQTRAVIGNVRDLLRSVGADLTDGGAGHLVPGQHERLRGLQTRCGRSSSTLPGRPGTTVAVHQLPHPHLLIEMQAVALLPSGGQS
ncbi:endoribonuclease L-PSP [Micromonospora sp. ATCC 39149]|nr:endoribonuclease L-PSP [Micromonospora sp. ATCC 39149]